MFYIKYSRLFWIYFNKTVKILVILQWEYMKIKLKINLHLKLNYLELLTPFSTENKITKDKNGKNASHLEIAEVILVNCDIVNIDYQQDVHCTFVPNKPFGTLLEISPTSHIFLKTFKSEFQAIRVGLADQNSWSLKIEGRINFSTYII